MVDFDGFDNKCTIVEDGLYVQRLRGATVARLTPDQKVACSNHVRVINIFNSRTERIGIHLKHNNCVVDLF